MKRPEMLTVSAVVLILLSLFQVLTALLMALAGTTELSHGVPTRPGAPQPPAWLPFFTFGLAAIFAALAAWGIVTAIGVYRLRRWARISILVIGACMAALGFLALMGTLVTAVFINATGTRVERVGAPSPAMMNVGFGFIALFYAAIAAVGAFWLVYFNRTPVRAAFAVPDGTELIAASRRPGLITAYVVLVFLGAAELVGIAFVPLPAILYGVAVNGWKKVAIYLMLAAIKVAIGVGLWKLAEWARRLALGYLAAAAAMMVLYLARPLLVIRANEAWRSAKHMTPSHMSQHAQVLLYSGIFGFSLLFMIAIAGMLHYYRGRFAPQAPAASIAEV